MKSFSRHGLIGVAALLFGCAATPPGQPDWPLEGVYWKLVSLRGQAVAPAPAGREPYLMLQAADRRVTGYGGCNRVVGTYMLDGAALRFGPAAGTRMACMTGMDVEAGYHSAMMAVVGWRTTADKLQLLDSNQAVVAEFVSGSERYACEGGKSLMVRYVNDETGDPRRAQAWLAYEGADYRMLAAQTASGARYAAESRQPGTMLEWITKGSQGMLRSSSAMGAEGGKTLAECVRKL